MPIQYGGGTPISKPQPKPQVKPQNIQAALAAVQSAWADPAQVAHPEPGYGGTSAPAVYNPQAVNRLAPVIDAYLARYDSPLTGLGRFITKRSRKEGIDPRLLVAIMGAESSFGKEVNPGENNPFGWGPHIQFDNWKDSIKTVAKGLSEGYFQEGLNTIPEIGAKWAPIKASNDPRGLNNNWVTNVTKFYKELAKERPTPPKLSGLSELIYRDKFYKDGQMIPGIGGHDTHVHFGATNPRVMLKALGWGQKRGLTFGENPYTGEVYPVHAGQSKQYRDTVGSGAPSMHYASFPGKFNGRELGQAWDVTDPSASGASLEDFFNWALRRFGGQGTFDYGARGEAFPVTATGTPQDAARAATAQQQASNASALSSAAFSEPRRGRKRAPIDEDIVARLIEALRQGQIGAQMLSEGPRSNSQRRLL